MIWLAGFDQPLSPEEQHRSAWQLLERVLAGYAIRLADHTVCFGPRGKPSLQPACGYHFSISHDSTMIALAISRQPVGIDVERIRPFRRGAFEMAFCPVEQLIIRRSRQPNLSFFARWCLKESELKRKGETVGKAMRQLAYRQAFSWERSDLHSPEFVPDHQALIVLTHHVVAVSGISYEISKRLEQRLHCL